MYMGGTLYTYILCYYYTCVFMVCYAFVLLCCNVYVVICVKVLSKVKCLYTYNFFGNLRKNVFVYKCIKQFFYIEF